MTAWTITLHDKIVKRFTLQQGQTLTIGRGSDADVTLDNTAISRLHTSITLRDGLTLVADLGSLNGTFVNGRKIDSETAVEPTDAITFGKFQLAPDNAASGTEVASTATPMDIDDETLFVPGQRPVPLTPRQNSQNARHQLLVVAGPAKGKQLILDGRGSIKIGKNNACDLAITGFLVAQTQCYILQRDDKFWLVPQRSWAATWLNESKVKTEQQLRKGDLIKIRSTTIRFE